MKIIPEKLKKINWEKGLFRVYICSFPLVLITLITIGVASYRYTESEIASCREKIKAYTNVKRDFHKYDFDDDKLFEKLSYGFYDHVIRKLYPEVPYHQSLCLGVLLKEWKNCRLISKYEKTNCISFNTFIKQHAKFFDSEVEYYQMKEKSLKEDFFDEILFGLIILIIPWITHFLVKWLFKFMIIPTVGYVSSGFKS